MKAAIIGASAEAVHAIEQARALHIETVALDGNPDAEGLKYADKGLVVDISDEDKTIEALAAEKPQFVLTVPIGRYLTTIGAVNDSLHLKGISKAAAVLCTDKYEFHHKLRSKGLRKCHCYLVNRDYLFLPEEISYPAILKPRYGSGSRGIYYVSSPEELTEVLVDVFQLEELELNKKAWETRCKLAPSWDETLRLKWETNEEIRRYLVEQNRLIQKKKQRAPQAEEVLSGEAWMEKMKAQFSSLRNEAKLTPELKRQAAEEDYVLEEAVEGVEYGVDGALEGCNFELTLLRKKLLTPPPARQAVGYLSVVPVEERVLYDRVRDHISQVVQALNLRDCLLHADLMIKGREIFVIELSARPSGHNLHNLFTPMATGIDLCREYIRYMCDDHHNFCPTRVKKMMIHYFDMENCYVHRVPKEEELILPEGVTLRKWQCNIKVLDYLEKVTTGHSIMGRGFFILEGNKESLLLEAAEAIKNQFEVS